MRALRALLIFAVLYGDDAVKVGDGQQSCVESNGSSMMVKTLTVEASDVRDCHRLINNAIWKAFTEDFRPQNYDPRPFSDDEASARRAQVSKQMMRRRLRVLALYHSTCCTRTAGVHFSKLKKSTSQRIEKDLRRFLCQ
eukprot:TRINITY_DN31308_c0_g1_i1.p2 TRINITY_DN31308_c0_g1~~TRINITY_DN31308_c0_g1_i1.p2  ORF type:complete len:139 (+),score=8.97 TRINITY_DN31308_c0_g1_i1:73-489(+)